MHQNISFEVRKTSKSPNYLVPLYHHSCLIIYLLFSKRELRIILELPRTQAKKKERVHEKMMMMYYHTIFAIVAFFLSIFHSFFNSK